MPFHFSRVRAVLLILAVVTPAMAYADPVFPGASGVGLQPPPGMQPATAFNGFKADNASIVITEMPKAAYAQIEPKKAMFAQRFGAKQADDVTVNGVRGFMVLGRQPSNGTTFRKWVLVLDGPEETALVSAQVPEGDKSFTDAAIDAAMRSVAFRKRPGLDEQVAALPFKVGDMSGFRASGTSIGIALILVDGPADTDPKHSQAHAIVALNVGTPPKDGREEFAKSQLQSFQAVRTTEITSAKLFDADGAQWAQVEAKGSEGPNETPVGISFFIRFGPSSFVTTLGVAPADSAAKEADRFKKLALSVKPKA